MMKQEILEQLEINECERGNILLSHDEEPWMNAWLRLLGDKWLQISYRPCNYPALDVSTVNISDEDLAEHIRTEFEGGLWYASKMNIEGVELDEYGKVA